MTEHQPGIIRRFFRFIGRIASGIRALLSLLFVVFFGFVIAGMFADGIQSIPEQGALYLAPSGVLVDQKSYIDPVGQLMAPTNSGDNETLVRDIIEALDRARDDRRITHLLLDTDYMAGGGISKLEEIGAALSRFKESRKPMIAVGDNFNQQQYFLAAHADEIILNPFGGVMLTGFGAYNSYFKDALDKLKINMHIFRVGKYKSAIEPFAGNSMSAEAKEETQALIDSLWQFYSSQIENLRQLPKGTIDDFASNLHLKITAAEGDSAALAKQEGLVDRIATRSEIVAYLNQVMPGTDGKFNSINMRAYLNNSRLASGSTTNKSKIAVVVAKGTILDGEQPEGSIGGDTLAGMFADLRDDDSVKAVVLRIDSGGGSAFASDIIRDAISATQNRGIPVVVSMGSYAASGGYWIAAEADQVLAMSTSLTGSIGVFGVIPTVEDSLAALGIYSDGVGTTNISGMMQLDRPMTAQTKMIFQAGVDNIYARFITLIADARGTTPAAVHEIAQGRVWTGKRALELGLVDQLGDLNEAIIVAANLAKIKDYEVDYRRKPMTLYEQLFTQFNSNVRASMAGFGIQDLLPTSLRKQAERIFKPLHVLNSLNDPKGLYLYCENCPL